MSDGALAYRDFTFPLNVFVHILLAEEGDVRALHYGLFDSPDEPLPVAQERSTALLLARLPPPPARLLEVGIGLGTTLARLLELGYAVTGITPDAGQIAMARQRHGDRIDAQCVAFEDFVATERFDAVFFQESSQYIDSGKLFAQSRALTAHVVVLDEFTIRPIDPPGLHELSAFLDAASLHGFDVTEHIDHSAKAAPTVRYFLDRVPAHRERLVADLGLADAQVDELLVSGERYLRRYQDGDYGYRLLSLRRETPSG